MNKILIIGALSLALTMAGSNASARKTKQTPATKEFHFKTGDDERRDAFVSDLMSKMSLEEKLGQLNLASSWMFRSTASDSQKEETMEGVTKGMYGALYGFNDVAQLRQIQEEAGEDFDASRAVFTLLESARRFAFSSESKRLLISR